MSDGVPREKQERYFVCRVEHFEVGEVDLEQLDTEAVAGFRWWNVEEIDASAEVFAPRRLGIQLRELMQQGLPSEPFDVGL